MNKHVCIVTLMLVLSTGVASSGQDQPAGDPYLLDDMEVLDEWYVVKDAKISEADSAAVGDGAMCVQFPGSVSRDLPKRPFGRRRAWDQSGGLSFWIKGDGSDLYGALSVHGWRSSMSYSCYFPLKDTNWHRVTVAWEQFVPERHFTPIGSADGLAPSGIESITLGDRWTKHHNNQPLPTFVYSIDQIRIEKDLTNPAPAPKLRPLDDVLAKLKARKPVHIVCLGDSITFGAKLPDPPQQRFCVQLQAMLRQQLGYDDIRIESRAVGGSRLSHARAWVQRDLAGPAPDLVTILYGHNDKKTYPPDYFKYALGDYLDRIARQTDGKTAVLLLTTLPGNGSSYHLLDDFAQAVRDVADVRGVALCDLHRVFQDAGSSDTVDAYFVDEAHPNEKGHALIARAIADLFARKVDNLSREATPRGSATR